MPRLMTGSGQAVGEDGVPVVGQSVLTGNINGTIKAESVVTVVPAAGNRLRLLAITIGTTGVEAIVNVQDEATALFSVLVPAKGTVTVVLPERGALLGKPGSSHRLVLKPSVEQVYVGSISFQEEPE